MCSQRVPTIPIMPSKVVETPYPLIDADPHASRVIKYFRPSDYAAWAGATAAFPAALYFWGMLLVFNQLCLPLTKRAEMADPTKLRIKTPLKLGGFLGFTAGFLLAYQRSSRAYILQYHHSSHLHFSSSTVLGLDRKQTRRREGSGRT